MPETEKKLRRIKLNEIKFKKNSYSREILIKMYNLIKTKQFKRIVWKKKKKIYILHTPIYTSSNICISDNNKKKLQRCKKKKCTKILRIIHPSRRISRTYISNDLQSQICCRRRKLISLFESIPLSTPPRFSRSDISNGSRMHRMANREWWRFLVNYDRYTYTRVDGSPLKKGSWN